jgi:ACS family glucarate transporter-like MFS transporter
LRPTSVRYRVVAFTLAMIAIAYLDRVCIAIAAPAIQTDLALSDRQMSVVFSAFTLSYALFEVPSGWLADRFGARIALSRIVVWWSAMTAATGLANGFGALAAVRFLFGLGEAGAFPATARIYARWLPVRLHGRLFGVLLAAAALGGAATQPIVAKLLGLVGWRWSFALFGVVGVVWALAFWAWFRDDPRAHRSVNPAEVELIAAGGGSSLPHAPVPWRALAANRTLVALCGMYLGAIYGWYFFITWLPTYLIRARGYTPADVGWPSALPLFGIAVGVLAGGWVSDHLRPRLGLRLGSCLPGLFGLPLAALAVASAALVDDRLAAVVLLACAAGCAGAGIAPAWAICVEIGDTHSAVVSGSMNTFGNIGGAMCPIVMALLVERTESWTVPLFTISAMYLVAASCWLWIDPTLKLKA